MKRAVTILALTLALGGCGAKKANKADDQRTASGQILPGSASDAMIAYDALTSRAPNAPRAAAAAPQAASAPQEEPAPAPEDAASAAQ